MNKYLFAVAAWGLAITSQAQKNIDGSFSVDDLKREYVIHLPPSYTGTLPLPLVLVFHGGGGNDKQMQRYMDMDEWADKDNFITVYPNGINKNWNDGREIKKDIASHDDVKFINQLLDTLVKHYSIDSNRIFSTGISNGGFFSIYLSYKLSNRLLAVAPVCASIPELIYNEFNPACPISILLMNGTGDPLVPFSGGEVGNRLTGSRGKCTSTDTTIARYISIDQTSKQAETINLPDKNKSDGCTAIQYTYAGGLKNTKVILVKVINGGHTLPGGSQYLPKIIIGKVCKDFDGAEMIWNFFKLCPSRS